MNDTERSAVLRTALLLVILEGWTSPIHLRARLGADVGPALAWLVRHGYVEMSEHEVVRWRVARGFETLWRTLIPDRPCPVRLCTTPRSPHAQELR